MNESNIVVLRGRVSSEPRARELPSGSILVQLEVTTRTDDTTDSVPVVAFDRRVDCGDGDEVVVVGRVRRRFFRAGGATHSRTEVVADQILRATRRKSIERHLSTAAGLVQP